MHIFTTAKFVVMNTWLYHNEIILYNVYNIVHTRVWQGWGFCYSPHFFSATDSFVRLPDAAPPSQMQLRANTGSEFSILTRDVAIIIVTINGGTAVRNTFIPTLADQIEQASISDSITDIFSRTNEQIEQQVPQQIPIMHTTLTKKLLLKDCYQPKRDLSSSFRSAVWVDRSLHCALMLVAIFHTLVLVAFELSFSGRSDQQLLCIINIYHHIVFLSISAARVYG